MTALRQHVRELMIVIHKITPELAAYHAEHMSDEEIDLQLLNYERLGLADTELKGACA